MGTEILLTGASGFAGRAVSGHLERQGHRVHAWSHKDGDITQHSLPAIRHVIHLAGKTFVPESWADPYSFYEANLMGTIRMLEFCRKQGASFLFISSYVYGKPQYLPVDEAHPLAAFNPYGQTKLMSEEAALAYHRYHQVPVTILRPFNLYGAGQDSRFLIPMLVSQAMDREQAEFRVADARPKRDYLYIDDFVELVSASLAAPAGTIVNGGSGVSHSIDDIAAILNRLTGQRKQVISTGQPRPDDVLDLWAGISEAKRLLGWEPKVKLEEGLAKIVASWLVETRA